MRNMSYSGLTMGLQRNVNALAVNNAGLFAGTSGGLCLSTNAGTNWSTIDLGGTSEPIVWSLAVLGTNLYVVLTEKVDLT